MKKFLIPLVLAALTACNLQQPVSLPGLPTFMPQATNTPIFTPTPEPSPTPPPTPTPIPAVRIHTGDYLDPDGEMEIDLYRDDGIVHVITTGAKYVDKILWQGVKPGDLPIQLPARFVFAVHLKTAKAIGVTIPQSILLRADEVIQ